MFLKLTHMGHHTPQIKKEELYSECEICDEILPYNRLNHDLCP